MRTIKAIKVSGTKFTTVGAYLRSHVWINKDNIFTFSHCFVANELLQLVEAPTVEPSVQPLAHISMPVSYSFKVLQYNSVSRKPLPQICVNKIVKLESVANLSLKSFVNGVLDSFKKGAGHIKQVLIADNFKLYCGNKPHNNTKQQPIYMSYGHMSSGLWFNRMEVSVNSSPL